MSTIPTDRAERLFSGPIGAEYEMLKLICPAAAAISLRVGEFVASLPARPTRPLELFEIGCGTGITTQALLEARPDLAITAVDNEPTMLAQARGNLSRFVDQGRVRLVEADALSGLRELPTESVDVVASGYAVHNFLNGYRDRVLSEIFRVLRPGGLFVNGDRYGLDDDAEHTRLTQEEARHYFKAFSAIGRYDLLEQWIIHLFSDESADHLMRLGPALTKMRDIGFDPAEVHFRDGVNTLLTAAKPAA
ncbi:class I SAM-dependent methyltransferase [Methylocapsa polymorpha]|uniref:Class I SAM-dependent methyltransferase n=1 Tax=Methylocapsa polymorpha TaxID=3080828 RepID=A0ABZ0HXJ3_9HYPH|nr:class I SAM-dependent methyltransferase [Methylocapsa sp. RX1]